MTIDADMTFRVGDWLTIIGGVAMAGGFFAFVRSALQRQEERNSDALNKVDKLEHRVRIVEQGHVGIATEIKGMSDMLRRVHDAVMSRLP